METRKTAMEEENQKLIREGNSFYEIDLECMRKKGLSSGKKEQKETFDGQEEPEGNVRFGPSSSRS